MRTTRRSFAALAIALLCSGSAIAAGRSVTIEVRDAQDRPVSGATVRIAADEMDAVGTTDAAGRVTVETTSGAIQVFANKDGREASIESAEASVTLVLNGGAQ
jgi:hypothetical protein